MRHSLWQSVQFAGRGLHLAFRSQRTMRIHALLACGVMLALVWLNLPAAETALLVLAIASVLSAELFNTAIEAIVDLTIRDRHHVIAGRAKDLSAAAVLVTAASAAIVGLVVLAPPLAAALGLGRLDAATVGRAAVLLAVLGFVAVVLRRNGERSRAEQQTPSGNL
ncbi:MAG: diacylglycerol kinase family protein [Armatimonadota bacterium]